MRRAHVKEPNPRGSELRQRAEEALKQVLVTPVLGPFLLHADGQSIRLVTGIDPKRLKPMPEPHVYWTFESSDKPVRVSRSRELVQAARRARLRIPRWVTWGEVLRYIKEHPSEDDDFWQALLVEYANVTRERVLAAFDASFAVWLAWREVGAGKRGAKASWKGRMFDGKWAYPNPSFAKRP